MKTKTKTALIVAPLLVLAAAVASAPLVRAALHRHEAASLPLPTDAQVGHRTMIYATGGKGGVALIELAPGLGSRTVWLLDTASFAKPADADKAASTPAAAPAAPQVTAVISAWQVDCFSRAVTYAGKALAFAPGAKSIADGRDVSTDVSLRSVPLDALQNTRHVLCAQE